MAKHFSLMLIFSLGALASAVSHPHVFVDGRVVFEFRERELAFVEVVWKFDELFTAMIAADYDNNGDGRFDRTETNAIREGAFSNLRYYDYFTYLLIDGRRTPVTEVQDFRVRLDDGNMTYRFRVPVAEADPKEPRSIEILLYDETYFTDIRLDHRYAAVRSADGVRYELSKRPHRRFAYSYGPIDIVPEAVRLRYRAP